MLDQKMALLRGTWVFIILISMMLHCASRIGILNYLYQQRYTVLNSVGISTENHISTCSSKYNMQQELLVVHHESEQQVPATIYQAQEILLYIQSTLSFQSITPAQTTCSWNGYYANGNYASPVLSIFQPPKISYVF